MLYPVAEPDKKLARLVQAVLLAVSVLTGGAVIVLGGYYLSPALMAAGGLYLAFSPLLSWAGMKICYLFACAIEL